MNRRVALAFAGIILAVPACLVLWYIIVFGVNVVYWEDWVRVALFQKFINGTMSLSDLFAQINEHRLPFPNMVVFAIALVTRYNTVAEMFFSWILVCLTCSLLFIAYWNRLSLNRDPKLLLAFLPVPVLMFSLSQYGIILWGGGGISTYLMIFASVATFFLLQRSTKIDLSFIASLFGATVSSYSLLFGMAVWPVGLFQISLSRDAERKAKSAFWCLACALTVGSYLYGWTRPEWELPLDYVIEHPFIGAAYLAALVGAPFSKALLTTNGTAVFGFVLTLVGLLVVIQALKQRLLQKNGVFFSVVFFVILSSLANTIGRAGFGIERALSYWYIPITSLGLAGLYLLAVSVSRGSSGMSRRFGVHALLTLFLLGLILSYGVGWRAGQNMRYSREMDAYVLGTYRIQSDESIGEYIEYPYTSYHYPYSPATLREQAEFLEKNGLNVFAQRTINMSQLVEIDSDTLFALEKVNDQQTPPFVVNSNQEETIKIMGWAVDRQANDAASAVFIKIDGKLIVPTVYGLDRQDVANHLGSSRFEFCGYIAVFSSAILGAGQHTMSLIIVSTDEVHYYYERQVAYLIVIA